MMTKTRHKRGPRGDIGPEDLLASGERILREKGLNGLSLRAVTSGAGITPTVLYTYFSDLGDLRNQLGDRFLESIDLSLLQSGKPHESLESFLDHVVSRFRAEPGFVELLAAQPIIGPHALALNEALLGFFTGRVGHSLQHAASATMLLTEWLHGHVLLLASGPGPDPQAVTEISKKDFPLTRAVLGQAPEKWAQQEVIAALTATT